MTSHDRLMIYGVTGHTGSLIARKAVERGLKPIVAARNPARLAAIAAELDLPSRVLDLERRTELAQAFEEVDVVLNAAGPFAATVAGVLGACMTAGTHYLDVTGELDVFQLLHGRDAEAKQRGVMIMPGVGFVIVPSDCLAAHVARRLPGARTLRIGISRTKSISEGSAKTMIELIRDHVRVRRSGRLTAVPVGTLERSFDYGCGASVSTAVSWPDVFTAYLTTGIPNIEVYVEASSLERGLYQLGGMFAWALRTESWQSLLKSQTSWWASSGAPENPGDGRRVFVAEAEDGYRRTVRSRLHTPDGYEFTATTALSIVERILAGHVEPGFRTPGGLYGPDLLASLDGVQLEDEPLGGRMHAAQGA